MVLLPILLALIRLSTASWTTKQELHIEFREALRKFLPENDIQVQGTLRAGNVEAKKELRERYRAFKKFKAIVDDVNNEESLPFTAEINSFSIEPHLERFLGLNETKMLEGVPTDYEMLEELPTDYDFEQTNPTMVEDRTEYTTHQPEWAKPDIFNVGSDLALDTNIILQINAILEKANFKTLEEVAKKIIDIKARFCKKPTIKYGSVNPDTSAIQPGSNYYVTCDSGYKILGGSSVITCSNGKLSSLPTCEEEEKEDPLKCDDLVPETCAQPLVVSQCDTTDWVAESCKKTCGKCPDEKSKNEVDLGPINIVDWTYTMDPPTSQGDCGACWAFAAASTASSAYYRATGIKKTFSMQAILDCALERNRFLNGCKGTSVSAGILWVARYTTLPSIEDYPYVAYDGACRTRHVYNSLANVNLKSYFRVKQNDESLIRAVDVGVVSVGIKAGKTFFTYKSGIYYDPSVCKGRSRVNHAVNLVGYGEEGDKKYWLLRNSWGPKWGEKGYIRMSRDHENTCSINHTALRIDFICKDKKKCDGEKKRAL